MLSKLNNNYVTGLIAEIKSDGKIHTIFNQTLTRTGRLSSQEPNLQNIPARLEYGKLIRKAFLPEKDSIILSSDYSQIELRVFASMSNATNLIETYEELAMFNQTVANSSNEYIRNHYYNEVQEYNENYAESLKKSSSVWFNVLYPKNTFKQISTIKFELRGDDVIELHQNN
jgi:DNA polymerase I-like protein with 3'-5' exonuclease and polymerase domains